jgi:hypothetical protein
MAGTRTEPAGRRGVGGRATGHRVGQEVRKRGKDCADPAGPGGPDVNFGS